MITHLHIQNYALIDRLDMEFHEGFSVITGETGAGKSIILGAISLLLGQRADSKAVKNGAARCTIEAHFDLSRYGIEQFFADNDIDYDAGDCILRRELSATGKSRAFINDTPVSLAQMKLLGQQLVDIHSQHQNLLLQEEDFQLNVVDVIADDRKLLDQYKQKYNEYRQAERQLADMKAVIEKAANDEDFLRFQLNELTEAHLEEGMQEQLEQDAALLSHAEDIKSALFEADSLLSNGDHSIIEMLKSATRPLSRIADVYPDIREAVERLESAHVEIKDIAREIGSDASRIDFDPQRLEAVNTQLDTIYSLQKKHHVDTVEALIALHNDIQQQLRQIEGGDESLAAQEKLVRETYENSLALAKKLSAERQKAAKRIEQEMQQRLVPLGMPNVQFKVEVNTLADKISQHPTLTPTGIDAVEYLFTANVGSALQPVSQIASGGEIARVMLALKAMISGTVKLPTIIFDEIDTGVSGKIAEKMGHIMKEMGQQERQVLSITHLPQIAALGTTHYKVYKEDTKEGTKTYMRLLTHDERITEIAQMLSGSDITEAAISNAKELLK
ncbi:MAG: DNA repair protein RecN [Prevotella sp.]|nr:DNA repair protein RecN [Prevotella sp.]